MARKRIIYQSQSVAIRQDSPAGATFNTAVAGVQSLNYGVDVSREDVMQYGDLGAIDRVITDAPSVSMDTSFYVGGFGASDSAEPTNITKLISGAMIGGRTRVFGGITTQEGINYTGAGTAVELISGSLTSLSTEASVGGIPTTSLSFEGTDISYGAVPVSAPRTNLKVTTQTGVTVDLGDTTISNPTTAADDSKGITNFQTVSVGFDLGTETLRRLGPSSVYGGSALGPYYYAKVPSFPATANMSFEGLAVNRGIKLVVDNLKASSRDTGATALTGGRFSPSITFGLTKYQLVFATLDSTNFSSSLGDNVTMDAACSVSIGGPNSVCKLLVTSP